MISEATHDNSTLLNEPLTLSCFGVMSCVEWPRRLGRQLTLDYFHRTCREMLVFEIYFDNIRVPQRGSCCWVRMRSAAWQRKLLPVPQSIPQRMSQTSIQSHPDTSGQLPEFPIPQHSPRIRNASRLIIKRPTSVIVLISTQAACLPLRVDETRSAGVQGALPLLWMMLHRHIS